MKQKFLLIILALTASAAQAGVFKCQAPEGMVYSERPCPPGSASQTIHTSSPQSSQSGSSNVDAVPLPAPDKQRGAYEAFLSQPNPKAFVICNDGRVISIVGKTDFVDQRLSSLEAGCSPYSINGNVVWSR